MKTKVIFRKFPDGELIALFPALAADSSPETCLSYQTTGQHGTASLDLCDELPAPTPEECEPLRAELKRIGYELEPGLFPTARDRAERLAQINEVTA